MLFSDERDYIMLFVFLVGEDTAPYMDLINFISLATVRLVGIYLTL
jgi:hypothetical protein